MTIREFCKDLPIKFTDSQYFELGFRIAGVWDSMLLGKKRYTPEGNFSVRDYPTNFLELSCIEDTVIKFATGKYKKLNLKNKSDVKTNK